MGLRAPVAIVDDDNNRILQEPTLIPPHGPVDASDQDDDNATADSEMAFPPPNANADEVGSLPRDMLLHRKRAPSVVT